MELRNPAGFTKSVALRVDELPSGAFIFAAPSNFMVVHLPQCLPLPSTHTLSGFAGSPDSLVKEQGIGSANSSNEEYLSLS